jgi:asparagine synthase (glutamine-hydrolysing)
MCGFTGFCDFSRIATREILTKMADSLHHRGPDAEGYFFQNENSISIGLGHRRLSIIDLNERANQPMIHEHLTMVYNGEVYNYREIKKELEQTGYSFATTSDSEVVLKAYHKWGVNAMHKFNGMFAFAMYNSKNKEITLVRDRAGLKPIFYYFDGQSFLFGSELKSLLCFPSFKKEIDHNVLSLYLNLGYVPTPYSIFSNTHKLLPGSILTFSIKSKNYNIQEFWKIEDQYNKPKIELNGVKVENIIEQIETLLTDSVKLRLVADVPVGLFLSGGYDSALLASILSKQLDIRLKAYTVGFRDKKFNEADHAHQISKYLGIDHTIYELNENEAKNIFANFPLIYDEPFSDTSGIPTIYLSSQLKKEGIKVVLTGDGTEETFAGYDTYIHTNNKLKILDKLPAFVSSLAYEKYLRKKSDRGSYPQNKGLLLKNYFNLKRAYGETFHHPMLINNTTIYPTFFDLYPHLNDRNSYYDKKLAIDFRTRLLDDFICKVDRGTMSQSIEAREPFLDYRLVEYLAQVPMSVRCFNGITKYPVKAITHKFIPEKMMAKPKKGFNIPMDDWLRGELRYLLVDFLDKKQLSQQGIFDIYFIESLKKKLFEKNLSHNERKFLLNTLLFQMWFYYWKIH